MQESYWLLRKAFMMIERVPIKESGWLTTIQTLHGYYKQFHKNLAKKVENFSVCELLVHSSNSVPTFFSVIFRYPQVIHFI